LYQSYLLIKFKISKENCHFLINASMLLCSLLFVEFELQRKYREGRDRIAQEND
jgi:hypothetical protein